MGTVYFPFSLQRPLDLRPWNCKSRTAQNGALASPSTCPSRPAGHQGPWPSVRLHRHGPHPVLVLISNCLSHCPRLPDKPQNPCCLPCARGVRHCPDGASDKANWAPSREDQGCTCLQKVPIFFPFLLTSGEKSQSWALAWINVHQGGGPFDSGRSTGATSIIQGERPESTHSRTHILLHTGLRSEPHILLQMVGLALGAAAWHTAKTFPFASDPSCPS